MIIFDCIGGKETEEDAFKVLKKSGRFVTVVGPVQYIGEEKLSWPAVLKVIGYVLWRMFSKNSPVDRVTYLVQNGVFT